MRKLNYLIFEVTPSSLAATKARSQQGHCTQPFSQTTPWRCNAQQPSSCNAWVSPVVVARQQQQRQHLAEAVPRLQRLAPSFGLLPAAQHAATTALSWQRHVSTRLCQGAPAPPRLQQQQQQQQHGHLPMRATCRSMTDNTHRQQNPASSCASAAAPTRVQGIIRVLLMARAGATSLVQG